MSCEGGFWAYILTVPSVRKVSSSFILMRSNLLGFHTGIVFSTEFTFECWLSRNCLITLLAVCKQSVSSLCWNLISATSLYQSCFIGCCRYHCCCYRSINYRELMYRFKIFVNQNEVPTTSFSSWMCIYVLLQFVDGLRSKYHILIQLRYRV